MADLFIKTGGDFSGLTFQDIAYGYFTLDSTGLQQNISSEVTQGFTPNTAGDLEGFLLCLRKGAGGTVTVKLQENTGSWVDRATKTIDLSTKTVNFAAWTYFEFATPYTITTAASTWRISVQSDDSDYWSYNNDSGTNYLFAAVLTSTSSYTSGDNIACNEEITVTIDQDVTTGVLVPPTNGVIGWENPPTSSYTLTVNPWVVSYGSSLEVGSEANPIPAAQQAVLNITHDNYDTYHGTSNRSIKLYGAKPTNIATKLDGDYSSGDSVITTTEDMSSAWSATDTLKILGRPHQTGYLTKTISSISGNDITLTATLGDSFYGGWYVWNYDKRDDCGIKFENIGAATSTYGNYIDVVFQGIHLAQSVYFRRQANYVEDTTGWYVGYVLTDDNIRLGVQLDTSVPAGTIEHVYENGTWGHGVALYTLKDYTIRNIATGTNVAESGLYLEGLVNCTVTDCQNCGGLGTRENVFKISAINSTFTRLKGMGGQCALKYYSSSGNTFTDCTFDGVVGETAVYADGNALATHFENCEFDENGGAGSVSSFSFADSILAQYIINNSSDFTVDQTSLAAAAQGSYIKAISYDDTANDHRTWWNYGKTQSVGDGLTDTTRHTTGSGKFAIRLEPTSSTDSFNSWSFDVPTGDIEDKTMSVGMWVKINSATYYGGTHTNPTLCVDYDNGTETTAVASDSTAWQFLSVSFTPTTDYGQITITVKGKTDATGTDAYFYVDDFSVLYPAGVTLDLGGLDLWANALPIVPPIATSIAAADVWNVQTSTLTGSGTIGARLNRLKNAFLLAGEIILNKDP